MTDLQKKIADEFEADQRLTNLGLYANMSRLDWLKERQSGIGASDAPNLVGVGFGDAASVYRSKVEPVNDAPPKGYLRRGLDLEPIVAAMYTEVMGVPLSIHSLTSRHPERPWQFCHVDCMRPDGLPVQLKTTAGFGDDWGPSGTDQVPDGYRIQCLHEMGVIGAPAQDLIALDVIAWEPRVYRLLFDAAAFDWLTRVEQDFWQLVEQRKPLGDWEERIAPVASQLIVGGKYVELGPEVETLIGQRKELGRIRDEADDEYKRIGQQIEASMGDAEIATCGGWKLKRLQIAAGIVPAYERKAYSRLDIRAMKGKR